MALSDHRTIAIYALKYASQYLKGIDTSFLHPVVASGIEEVIDDLDGLISKEISDLPF